MPCEFRLLVGIHRGTKVPKVVKDAFLLELEAALGTRVDSVARSSRKSFIISIKEREEGYGIVISETDAIIREAIDDAIKGLLNMEPQLLFKSVYLTADDIEYRAVQDIFQSRDPDRIALEFRANARKHSLVIRTSVENYERNAKRMCAEIPELMDSH